jgi:putative flippase GtrA
MIKKILKEKTDNTFIQLFRYTLVGGFALIVDFSSLFILTEFFNVYYLTSAAIAFLLGIIVNYYLSIIWVFNKRTLISKSSEFAVFAGIGIIGLILNELLIWFFTEHIHFHYLISKIISAFFIYFWNFFARKFTLFN